MYSDQTKNSLSPCMFGGRPKMSAGDAFMCQQMMLDIAAYKCLPTTLLSLDASKCFDQIFPVMANISLRTLGAPPNIVIVISKVLCNTTHRIRTAYGVSQDHVRPNHGERWSGIGKGSGASCPSWLGQQAIMIHAINKMLPPTPLYDPTNTIVITNNVTGFIDDTNIIQIHEYHDKNTTQRKIQTTYNTWKRVLEVTGGVLSPEK